MSATIVQRSRGRGNRTFSSPITAGNLLVLGVAFRGGLGSIPGYSVSPAGVTGSSNTIAWYTRTATGFESLGTAALGVFGNNHVVGWYEVAGASGISDTVVAGGALGDVVDQEVVWGAGVAPGSGDLALVIMSNHAAGVLDTGINALGWHWDPSAGLSTDLVEHATDGSPGVLIAEAAAGVPAATWIGHTTVDGYTWAGQAIVFAGVPVPPEPGIGLDVYDPDDVYLATLGNAEEIKIRVELNGTGFGSFRINRYMPEATEDVLKAGNYVRVTIPQIDPDPIFGFFLEGPPGPEDPTEVLVSHDERGGEDITWGGRGSLSYWDRAIWIADSFLVPWWPAYFEAEVGTPPSNAIGALAMNGPRNYYHYTTSGLTITNRTLFHTDDFTAWYDTRRVYTRADGTKITLVHLIAPSAFAGFYVHPYGVGVVDYRRKSTYALGNSILMEQIGAGDTPGAVLYAMYGESQAADRPIHPLPRLTVDFSATLDSDGNAWTTTEALKAVSAELGDDYLSTISKLINTGAIDIVMGVDLQCQAFNAYGRNLSGAFGAGKVRFEKGVNIADDLERDLSDQPAGTWAEVLGSEQGSIARVDLPGSAGMTPREISVRGESTDTAVLEALGLAELETRLLHSDAVGFAALVPRIGDEDELVGKYLPGPPGSARGNYWIGDLVTLHTGSDEHDFDNDAVRIAAITLFTDDANALQVQPEVMSGFGGLPDMGTGSSSGPTSGSTSPGTLSDLYQTLSERDQPLGYPSLDDDGHVPAEQLALQWKGSVRVVATANLALASIVPGLTVDGVVLAEGDEILLVAQSTASQNGVRVVPAVSGTPLRRPDLDDSSDFVGAVVLVRAGTLGAGRGYRCTNLTPPTVDTTSITWLAWLRAVDVPITDAGGYYAATDVEAALQEEAAARLALAALVVAGSSKTWKAITTAAPQVLTSDGSAVWVPLTDGNGNAIYIYVEP